MTLCIIDMQPKFDAASSSLARRIANEVRRAKSNREGIILAEYYRMGPTHANILTELKTYDRQTIIIKDDDDGADVILAAAQSLRFNMDHFRLCGVNTCCCVWETFWSIHNCTDARMTLLSNLVSCECGNGYGSKKECVESYSNENSHRVHVRKAPLEQIRKAHVKS